MGEFVTVPGGAILGGVGGAAIGGVVGAIKCSQGTEPTSTGGSTGGGRGQLGDIYERSRRLNPNLTEEELVKKIRAMFPKTWTVIETQTIEGTHFSGARGEGILVTEDGEFAGRVEGVTIENGFRLR